MSSLEYHERDARAALCIHDRRNTEWPCACRELPELECEGSPEGCACDPCSTGKHDLAESVLALVAMVRGSEGARA